MERVSAKVALRDGTVVSAEVEIAIAEEPCRLTFLTEGLRLKRRDFEADDLFEAMKVLREELAQIDAKLLCAGARTNAYPSAMSRDMTKGRKVYLTTLGQAGGDLVDLFDAAEPESIGGVEEQQAFHLKWLDSFR